MEPSALVEVVATEGDRLLAAAVTGLDRPVAACPGWDVARLVVHVGRVHDGITRIIEADSTERPTVGSADRPAGDVIAWGRARLDRLVEVLRATDPARPIWTWGDGGTVGWYARRMAHETLVHRWDVESAVAAPTPIDGDLAADGVDELLHVGMRYSSDPTQTYSYPSGSLHLHRTDGPGEWLVLADDGGGLVVTREHAKGDVAVRGSGADLLLYLWGRSGDRLEVFGDEELAQAWARVAP